MHMFGSAVLFLLAVALLAYIPGRLLLRVANVSVSPLDMTALSLNLGLVASGIVFWLLSYFSLGRWLALWALVCFGILAYLARGERPRVRLCFKSPQLLLVVTIGFGVLLLALLPVFYSNLTLTQDGQMRVSALPDVFLHGGIANELTHAIPPQDPVFSGQPLSYHVGADLVTAMFANVTGLSVADLTVRFVPTLFLITTLLSVFCFARAWLASDYGAGLVTFLVFFGEDFSFIPGLLQRFKGEWSVAYFSAPTTFSLFEVNPMLPGLGLLFAVLLCLANAFREQRCIWQLFAGLLFMGLAECKIISAAHLGISLAICGVIYLVLFRNPRMLQVAVIAAICALPVIIRALLLNRNAAEQSVTFFQTHYLERMVNHLGLTTQLASLPLPIWLSVSLSIYLLGSLGLRAVGVPALLRDLLHPRRERMVRFLVATFVLIGAVLGLVVTLEPKNMPGAYNNGIWLYVDSKYAIWLFGVEAIQALLWTRRRSITQAAIAGVALMVSVPSTINHFSICIPGWQSALLSAQAMEAVEFLRVNSRPGEVVLSPQEMIGPVLIRTKCHVPIGPYATGLAPTVKFRQRMFDWHKFWADWRDGVARSDILRVYRVNYLLINKKQEPPPSVVPGLTVIFDGAEWRIYRVDGEAIQPAAQGDRSKKTQSEKDFFAPKEPPTVVRLMLARSTKAMIQFLVRLRGFKIGTSASARVIAASPSPYGTRLLVCKLSCVGGGMRYRCSSVPAHKALPRPRSHWPRPIFYAGEATSQASISS
jgi:hypothetical protein